MDVMTNISLKQYTTMKLGGEARYMATADSASDVVSLYRNARKENLPIFVLGGGSNVITHDEVFEGNRTVELRLKALRLSLKLTKQLM